MIWNAAIGYGMGGVPERPFRLLREPLYMYVEVSPGRRDRRWKDIGDAQDVPIGISTQKIRLPNAKNNSNDPHVGQMPIAPEILA